MNSVTIKFVKKFEQKYKEEQKQIEEEIVNYLNNCNNKELFEQIMEFIDYDIDDIIENIDEYECANNIIKENGKEKVISILKKEINGYEFYFEAKKLLYSYKIKFKIMFKNFEYNYMDSGDIADYGANSNFYFEFDENKIDSQIKKILSLFFNEHIVREYCYDWLNKYHQLNDD